MIYVKVFDSEDPLKKLKATIEKLKLQESI